MARAAGEMKSRWNAFFDLISIAAQILDFEGQSLPTVYGLWMRRKRYAVSEEHERVQMRYNQNLYTRKHKMGKQSAVLY